MMRRPDALTVDAPSKYLWHGQLRHAILLAVLAPGAWALAGPSLDAGAWYTFNTREWFAIAMAVPVVQQVAVVLFWRTQLCFRLVSRIFGAAGFVIWGAVFFPLLILRPLTILAVGLADFGGLPIPRWATLTVGLTLIVPALWTMHSVARYFGFARALGGDHFFERYRTMPMVRLGAFRHSSNAMYTFVFFGLWGLALVVHSRAALAAAIFQHAYIWVHWYCTEQPDGVVLYGQSQEAAAD